MDGLDAQAVVREVVAEWKREHPLLAGDDQLGWVYQGVDDVEARILARLRRG